MRKDSDSKVFTAARLGLYLMGGVWLILGALTIFRLSAGSTYGHPIAGVVIAVLTFGNALAFLAAGWGLGRYPRVFAVLSIFLVVVNIVLSFTDQVGPVDVITAVVDGIILVLLILFARGLFTSK